MWHPLEDGAIRGVITEYADSEAILAKRVIDATGTIDMGTRAGAPVRKSPKEEMEMAVSVMSSMSGVNKRRFDDAVKADPQTYADWSARRMDETTWYRCSVCSRSSARLWNRRCSRRHSAQPVHHCRHLGDGDGSGDPDGI